MEVKLFEVRDEGTNVSMIGIKLHSDDAAEIRVAARAGYSRADVVTGRFVLLTDLYGQAPLQYDPERWDRTRRNAHEYITEYWDKLKSGEVVDVQYILGETAVPKEPETM
jgi:hypothetical protein